nr:zf-HC2 domain-containing protein [bacterium]
TRDEEREFYECVDPDVGDLVSRHREPDLEPALRRRLENHLEICDACRWELELQNVVVDGLAGGALRIDPAARRDRASSSRWLAGAGGPAPAPSPALVFPMPPVAPKRDPVQRAAATEVRFVRPAEKGGVLDGRPRLSRTPLAAAVLYRITLRGAGGGRLWADSTRSTGIRVPAAAGIPRGSRVRAFLEPVPADLAASRGVSVTFRTDGLGGFLAYRLGAAAGWLRAGGLAGLAMLITGAALRLRRRGSPGNAGQPPIA